ncbi:hypothetical protein JKP88DRAFT_351485 [Tribonema minus]|uniref:Uncharacterized protein n=1 Tax=Tribonema minus TaxID=303371 RepID=A0A835YS17_9STRA|nr:hypothetical protein JKP88DRAFT_351485 [Tribonema minus]
MDSFVGMDKVFDLLPRGGMFYHDFVKGCGAPGVLQEANGDALVVPSGTSHANMVAAADVPLLVRDFSRETAEPYIKYGFEVCHPEKLPSPVFEPGVNYTLPAEISGSDWIYADWVYAKSNEIVAQLRAGADEVAATPGSSKIVCVQVRRGDLVITPSMRSRYPGLDVQTSAEAILDTLRPIVPEQSMLYIATNEQDPHFFDGLNARYHVRTLDYFLTPQEQSQLLPPSLTLLDYTILRSCDQLIPTFPAVDSKGEGSHGVSLYSHLRNSPGPG